MLNKLNNNTKWQYAVVLFALFPLLIINQNGWHDWGGDFAQYIHQAINIWEGVPIAENHYVFNPDHPFLAPPTYPVGFPLLLVPVYAVFGNSIFAFKIYISLFLIASMLVFFELIRKQVNLLPALLVITFLSYNHWVLEFKGNILSDIPFMFFFLLSLLIYSRFRNRLSVKTSILIGFFIGFSILIKNIGASLAVMVIIDQLVLFYRQRNFKPWLLNYFTIGFTLILVYVFAQILFPPEKETFSFFSTLFSENKTMISFGSTSHYYLNEFEGMFFLPVLGQSTIAHYTSIGILILSVVGIIISIKRKSFLSILTLTFVCVVLLFPNQSQGIRYFSPIFPIVFFFFLIAIKSFGKRIEWSIVILMLVGHLYLVNKQNGLLSKLELSEPKGPTGQMEKDFFNFINHQTNENAVFVFEKPRVLGLYGQRNSFAVYQHDGKEFVKEQLNKLHWDYIASHPEVYNHSLDLTLRDLLEKEKVECIYYQEDGFALFRRR